MRPGLSIPRAALAACALLAALPAASRAAGVPVPVLMYHKVGETAPDKWWVRRADFERHLEFLRAEGYATVLPDEVADAVGRGAPLPRRPVMITFDDGYRNLLTDVEPLLAARGFRAVAYLPTSFIGPDDAGRLSLEGTPCLTWEEVRGMRSRGVFAFGSHGRAHRDLRRFADPGADLRASRDDFRRGCGAEPDAFCYPFGRFLEATVQAVRDAGFRTAVTCDEAVATVGPGTDLLRLPRVHVVGGERSFGLRAPPGAGPGKPVAALTCRGEGLAVDVLLRSGGAPGHGAWSGPRVLADGREERVEWPPPPGGLQGARVEVWEPRRVLRLWSAPYPAGGGGAP